MGCMFGLMASPFLLLLSHILDELTAPLSTFFSHPRGIAASLGGRVEGTSPKEKTGACLLNNCQEHFLCPIFLGCILSLNLHQVKDSDGRAQTRKLRLREDYVHRSMAEPRRGSKPPLLTAASHRLTIPKRDEASAGLKVQTQPELPFTGGLLGARH